MTAAGLITNRKHLCKLLWLSCLQLEQNSMMARPHTSNIPTFLPNSPAPPPPLPPLPVPLPHPSSPTLLKDPGDGAGTRGKKQTASVEELSAGLCSAALKSTTVVQAVVRDAAKECSQNPFVVCWLLNVPATCKCISGTVTIPTCRLKRTCSKRYGVCGHCMFVFYR